MARKRQPAGDQSPTPQQTNPEEKPFTPEVLDRTIIAIPLLDKMDKAEPSDCFDIIIDVNLEYSGGRAAAREFIWKLVDSLGDVQKSWEPNPNAAAETSAQSNSKNVQGINRSKSKYSQQYLFGRLSVENIRKLVQLNKAAAEANSKDDRSPRGTSALYRIWLDHEVKRFTNVSISTVKADAARNAFSTSGKDIVWAVIDTGVDRTHPHFAMHENLKLSAPLHHRDFTSNSADENELERTACVDAAGHGTHVAGIIAGQFKATDGRPIVATVRFRDEMNKIRKESISNIPEISGMAPQCKILSLKALDGKGAGHASNLIAALEYIQELNGGGRRMRVHGVNMSVGYDFEPKWFACGQSPLCVEVDRLVSAGVVVVVAAGNTGYGFNQSLARGPVPAGQDVTINDPGNADMAITVGSTHRDMPHVYGVSYFSSKGPTGDGRLKPDIVAPGEKIISCQSSDAGPQGEAASANGPQQGVAASQSAAAPAPANAVYYKEDSGTSMAAPHVSGVIAAFLSVRREFIGKPGAVKQIFMSTATDLKRATYFQGRGLVDLMRAIQSV
jgi:subtilisin family serine protease